MENMVSVSLDIAGFYFRALDVPVPDGSPVRALMDAVRNRKLGENGATLEFDTEFINGQEFLDSITVNHIDGSAISGQSTDRVYPDGVYAAADEKITLQPGGLLSPLLASSRNATGVLAWQYYVYDADSVDLNRRFGPRRVVPFSEVFKVKDDQDELVPRGLKEGDTVVWRLVQIRTRPDGGIRPQTDAEAGVVADV
ncbi:MAG: hypothetical protein AAF066_02295 [Pseudomonadota bacterium]